MTFKERAIIGMEMLKNRPPVTLEQARAQAERIKQNSISNNKKK